MDAVNSKARCAQSKALSKLNTRCRGILVPQYPHTHSDSVTLLELELLELDELELDELLELELDELERELLEELDLLEDELRLLEWLELDEGEDELDDDLELDSELECELLERELLDELLELLELELPRQSDQTIHLPDCRWKRTRARSPSPPDWHGSTRCTEIGCRAASRHTPASHHNTTAAA